MAFNIVRYSQQDPQWKNDKISSGPDTIGYVGCALTCVAMYSSGWGYTETPRSMNQKLIAKGGYLDELIRWGVISLVHPEIKYKSLNTDANAPINSINASVAAGQPVIVEVDFSPDAGLQTHWVVIYSKKGDDYLILDPWPYPSDTQEVTLLSRFSHGQSLQHTIKAVVFLESSGGGAVPAPTPPIPPTPNPLPTPVGTNLVVEVIASATAGIKLHTQASVDSPANYAEMPGVPLKVIEDKTGALAKIGQYGQWIYIQDPDGHQGYVAGWYVEISLSTTPAPTPQPGPAPTPPPSPTTPAPTPAPDGPPPASGPQRLQVVVLNSVGASGLVVRQQPSPGGVILNKEKAGARLTVIEPAETAIPKIGVIGKWVAVKASNNQRGYVMAQYIKLKQ
jgi:hypothetical protein